MKILLPATIDPPSIRKDGSCKLKFDTRELTAEEIFTIMQMRNSEGYVCYAPNEDQIEIPDEPAVTGGKTNSQRVRNVHFVYYKQLTESGEYVGLFETFHKELQERYIESIKNKLN